MKKPNEKNLPNRLLEHDQIFLSQGFKSLAGVDEAGRGPLAGPVVASAVIVRDFSFDHPVNDSKKLTPRQRERAFEEILRKCWVGIGVVEHHVIDQINILQAAMRAMEEAVRKLPENPDMVLIDGPSLPGIGVCPQTPIIDGDAKSFSVACASVAAKVTRDRMMDYYDQVYPVYGFAKHRGYGTPEHLDALKKFGPCRIHRRTFEPVRSMIGRYENIIY